MSLLIGATSACAGAAGAAGGGGDLGDTIDQSLRFRGGQALHHTFSRASSGGTATLSFWVKIAELDREHCFIINKNGNHRIVNVRNLNDWCFNAAGSSFTSYDSNTLARDPSAWYHVLVIQDSSVTSLYVNGSQVGSSTSGASGFWNSTGSSQLVIGAETDSGGGSTSVCYLAEYNLLDGTAIGVTDGVPDEFGRYNEDGVWVPKSVSSLTSDQYGADGFRLVFDSSADGGIGDDSAPTGGNHASANDFTAVGFDTADISSSNEDNDIDYNDTPTNNYATLNPLLGRSASLNFEHANLRAQFGGGGSHAGMAGFGMIGSSGKYYWEVTLKEQKEGGLGIVSEDFDLENGNTAFGTDTANGGQGWEWILTEGRRDNNGVETPNSHTVPSVGDTIGFLLDTDAGTCTIEINGVAQTANNGAEYTNIPTDKTIYPYFRLGGASGDANLDWNFGQMDFQHEPAGYQHVATNNLPEPTIKNGKEHFGILTYAAPASPSFPITIDGSGGNNGDGELDFDGQPDLVWIKMRNGGQNNILFDSVRGTSVSLRSDGSNPEIARTNFAFATNGFTFSAQDAESYQQNDNYVAWCWKAGGTAVSNTDGTNSNTVNVSANQDGGFSIVTYTGETSNNPNTIGHGLNAVPEFIIVKRRDAIENWAVYHASLGNDRSLELHDSSAQSASTSAFWNSTTPTSSVFSVGNGGATNEAGGNYVAYLWAPVEGYSKFGSYTGGGSGSTPDYDGPYIHLGFRPAWLLIKRFNAAGDSWILLDSTRDTQNFAFRALKPDTSDQEISSGDQHAIDFLSNGFKCKSSNANINLSGASYVYMAFAESPFGGENAPPATAR